MQYTGERFIPLNDPWMRRSATEHLHRYYMIAPHLEGKAVLDAACGSGYGSKILSDYAFSVVGTDISEEAIEYAAEHFSAPGIEFVTASAEKLPFAHCSFDAVVSFETIEHLCESAQKAFLNEIRRLLKPDGVLVISTPNKNIENIGNPYHIREFHTEEFARFLSEFFSSVRMYSQDLASFSIITDTGGSSLEMVNSDGLQKTGSLYDIAVCGDGATLLIPPSLMRHDSLYSAQKQFYVDVCNNECLLRSVYKDMSAGTAYFSDGSGFSENRKISVHTRYSPESGGFFAEFPVPAGTERVQYNPCDTFLCMCRIDSVSGDLSAEPVNMEAFCGYDIALEPCPHYYITGDFSEIKNIRIIGVIKIFTNRDFLSLLRDFSGMRRAEAESRAESQAALLEIGRRQMNELNHALTALVGNMDALLKKLDARDNALALKDAEIASLARAHESMRLNLEAVRRERDSAYAAETEARAALDVMDGEHSSMLEQLNGAGETNAALEAELRVCRDRLGTIPEMRRQIDNLELRIAGQQNDIREKNYIISQIHNSNAWALVSRYYKMKDYFKGIAASRRRIEKDVISVVIPTKNAGANFSLLMACLAAQRDISPDIIVVDSGSADATCDIASEFGARVITIAPESFSHSRARNLGVSKANGEYTLLLTQDALPCSGNFLRDILAFLKSERLSALSCLEFPRPGCDMMHAFSRWNHVRTLGYGDADYVSFREPGDNGDMCLLRKKAGLSNVCCLIKTGVARKYKYCGDYAEDLELGLRLYKGGHRLGFMQSLKVLHSHSRPPSYYLKRTFADTLALTRLFPAARREKYTLNDAAGNILKCLSALSGIMPDILLNASGMCTVTEYSRRVRSAFDVHGTITGCAELKLNDDALTGIIYEFRKHDDGRRPDTMFASLHGSMELALEYLTETHSFIDADISSQFAVLLLSLFAARIGESCAYYSLNHPAEYAETLAEAISVSEV